ncbi:hypothetical protein AZH44_00010 [Corynebacterium striatum]|uniref:hypothetical protein n=1 Tax=Corynebacterium striatum TaxID=43770 RepID=UPI000C1CC4A9|nr:hypothetical protein [Corynebacterium striatum]PIS60847.1 hypothetical protein AZH44_00010 [Corynebacterium striatum]
MFNTMVPQSAAEAGSQESTASEESKKPAVVVEDGILKMTGKCRFVVVGTGNPRSWYRESA